MRTRIARFLCAALVAVAFGSEIHAQGTAFTYQGRLNDNGAPATGVYDLRFTLYDAAAGAGTVAGPVTASNVGVTNGLFTVLLDFGENVFTGPGRWLQIGVRTNGSGTDFTLLLPRQALTATPYAITASNLSGSVSASQLHGTISSNNIGAGSITTTMLAARAIGSSSTAGNRRAWKQHAELRSHHGPVHLYLEDGQSLGGDVPRADCEAGRRHVAFRLL